MRIRRALTGLAAALAVGAAGAAAPLAGAATFVEKGPQTPENNDKLPVVETTRNSPHLKANILNPHPVCNSAEDFRTVVYEVRDNFAPVGTISTTNKSNKPVELTQELSKSQSIGISVKGDRTQETSVNLGGDVSGDNSTGSVGIASSIAHTLGFDISYELSWSAGQTIGPYEVDPGYTGEATYGFRTVTLDGTQQYCKPNGTWSNPLPWRVFAPVKNEVEFKLYDDPVDSWQGTVPEDQQPVDVAGDEIVDGETVEPDISSTPPSDPIEIPADQVVPAEDVELAAAEENLDAEASQEAGPAQYDLQPYFTSAAGKAPGFAGLVALRVKNVGTERYYEDDLATSFRVDVKVDEGPEHVDRLITPGNFNGAHIRDLGFDKENSVRSFQVNLANPINPGEEVLIANFNFGDGLTKEGRLYNYLEVTQTGRVDGDESTHNDQHVDSRENTFTHINTQHPGVF